MAVLWDGWEKLSVRAKILLLEAETTVMKELLIENEELVALLKTDASQEACLAFVSENW